MNGISNLNIFFYSYSNLHITRYWILVGSTEPGGKPLMWAVTGEYEAVIKYDKYRNESISIPTLGKRAGLNATHTKSMRVL